MTSGLDFDDLGTGERALLLVHGHPFDRSMWRPQAEAFAKNGWRVLVPDLPGYGGSAVADDPMTQDAFAAVLAGFMDDVGVVKAVVGGLSMGGQIAMAFAANYPDRTLGLLLAATFETPETSEGVVQRNATAERVLREGMDDYAEELLPKMLAASTIQNRPELAAAILRMMAQTSPLAAAAALRGRALRADYAPTLRRFSRPVSIVVGTEDEFTTVEDAKRMKRLMPHARMLVIQGAGHMPNLEAEEQFNTILHLLLEDSFDHV